MNQNPDQNPGQGESGQNPEGFQQVQLKGVTARVPEAVGRGAFSTAAIVMSGPNEFILDFVQQMGRPHHVVSRVIVPHAVMPKLITALEQNMAKYERDFGKPPELPKRNSDSRPSIQDVYDNLKLSDEMLSGTYANGVMVGHSAAEFSFDFITNFFPHSSVSSRVFLSAPHVPPLLESLKSNFRQFQQRVEAFRRRRRLPASGGSDGPAPGPTPGPSPGQIGPDAGPDA